MLKSTRSFLLISTLAAVTLAGCYETDATMDVKKDGTVKFNAEAVMRKDIYDLYTRAVGSDIVKEKCEAGGGEFNTDMNHVNCKVEVDTTMDDLIAGNVQNEKNSAPLNLSGLTVVDNGDGTYAMDFPLDWALVEGAVVAHDAAEETADDAGAMKEAADGVEDATDHSDDAVAVATSETSDGETAVVASDNEGAKQAREDADQVEDDSKDLQNKIKHYLDGYHVVMTFKAPNVLDGNGEMHGDHEMKMDVDLGKVNDGEQQLPESFMVNFSLDK